MNVRNKRVIHTDIIRNNMQAICNSVPPQTHVLAVVKSDAYGHGMLQTAEAAIAGGAEMLAVATVDEGAKLRKGGIQKPILVLGALSSAEVKKGVLNDLIQTVCSCEMVRLCQEAAAELGRKAQVHLKIDTGMNRIGVRNRHERDFVLNELQQSHHVILTGVFTHFADADGKDDTFTREQFHRFLELTGDLPESIIRHCANSAAIHRFPEMAMDMVRAGISLYGYPPVHTPLPLRPAMEWIAAVSYVKEINPGDTVSYGRIYRAERSVRVATVTCGYGDGYHRSATGCAYVLIHDKKVPVIGRICMDQMMVDVSEVQNVQPGDEAVLMGSRGKETITAEDLALAAGTISYEVLLAATDRVKREWI